MHLFLYMFTLYFIAIRQWDQTLRERNEYKGALEKVIKKRQILCKFIKHVFLHITKYFFLFHFSKKEYSDFIFYMSWKIPIKKAHSSVQKCK